MNLTKYVGVVNINMFWTLNTHQCEVSMLHNLKPLT